MGLFGYSEKDFNKNSAKISAQLTDLLPRVGGKMGIGSLLNKAILAIQGMEYPQDAKGKKDGKQIEQIDERIFGLIDKLYRDLQQGKIGVMAGHASMIVDAITKSREFGEEKLSPVRLQYEEALTKLKGDIEDVIKQKADYQEELRRIEDESADLPEDSVEFEALEIQYERVEDNIAAANERFSELRIEYDSYAKELRVYAEDEEFEDLPEEITSPKDFSMFIEKLSEKKAKRAGRREQKREVLEEYQAEKRANLAKEGRGQSGLRAKRQAEEEAKLQGNVGNSEYRSSGEGKSSLRERMGR